MPYAGVCPLFHGVIAGDIDPELGVAAELNRFEGIIASNRVFTGIAMAFLHSSTLSSRSKQPVPILASCPSMIFSDTPFMGSISP